MKRLSRYVSALALLLATLFGDPAKSQDRVVTLTNGEFPPYLGEQLKGYGVASQIVTEAFALAGYRVEYGFFPWRRSMVLAELGEWDGTVVWSWSEERDKLFLYSDPVMVTREVFFHRADKPFAWQSYDDLADLRIGATVGYFYGDTFQEAEKSGKIQVERIVTDLQNLKKLLNDRIDLSLQEANVAHSLIARHLPQYKDLLVPYSEKPTRITTLHLLISKAIDGGAKMITDFNEGLRQLRESGRVDEIFQQAGLERHRLTQ